MEYLIQMRWPDGFVCPSCDGRKAWRTGRMLFHCAGCDRQVSATAGTIFQGTRKPLQMWFRAMVRPGRDRLSGLVEVDETYVGGPEERPGRGAADKTLVVIAVEKNGRALGRTRMAVVCDASRDQLCGFVQACVEPASTVRTDGWQGYRDLKNRE